MSKKAFVFLCFALTTLAVSNRLIAQNPTISLSQSLTYSGIQDYLKEIKEGIENHKEEINDLINHNLKKN